MFDYGFDISVITNQGNTFIFRDIWADTAKDAKDVALTEFFNDYRTNEEYAIEAKVLRRWKDPNGSEIISNVTFS